LTAGDRTGVGLFRGFTISRVIASPFLSSRVSVFQEFVITDAPQFDNTDSVISGLLTPIGKTSREVLISKEPTKFVEKICVHLRCNKFYQNKRNDNPEKGIIDVLFMS
jgi:hypothetical protein